MTEFRNTLKKIGVGAIFIFIAPATFFLSEDLDMFLLAIFSMSVIAFIDRHERRFYSILLILLGIRFIEFIFNVLVEQMYGFAFLLLTGLVDFLLAFLLVHYYQESSLQKFCRAKCSVPVMPQVHWIAVLLGISCFYRMAAAIEWFLFELDHTFFEDEVPFFFGAGPTVVMSIRVAVEVMLWSMLVYPRNFSYFKVRSSEDQRA